MRRSRSEEVKQKRVGEPAAVGTSSFASPESEQSERILSNTHNSNSNRNSRRRERVKGGKEKVLEGEG